MGPPGPGWCLNSSYQTDARLDLLDRDTWPDCFPTLLLGHGYGIVPKVGCCWWCHYYLFYLYCLYFIAHPTILLMFGIVLCKCSGNVLIGYVIFKLKWISIYLPEHLHTPSLLPHLYALFSNGCVWEGVAGSPSEGGWGYLGTGQTGNER